MTASATHRSPPRDGPLERGPGPSRHHRPISPLLAWGVAFFLGQAATAAELNDAEALFRAGEYRRCAEMAAVEIDRIAWSERWSALKIESELALGKTAQALDSMEEALRRFPTSVTLRLLGRDVFLANDRGRDADAALDEADRLIQANPQRYATPEGLVAVGRYFLIRGADAKSILDQFFDRARKAEPDLIDAYLATAELALQKQDDALAAETLQKAPKAAAEDPAFHHLLALAFSDGERARSESALDAALKINPRHADSLLLKADHLIDAERYGDADQILERVLAVDPDEPRAWSYRAVLAHLRGDRDGEARARRSARSRRKDDPAIDHLIGRKLSQNYRFGEGAADQREALAHDPNYLPARVQLCQDLLRLGDEEEGWKLAAETFAKDAYNVVAFNLVTLHDRIDGFRTLRDDGFVVRMDPREADLYGERVLALLRRARKTLGEKYGAVPREPVIVEIFPQSREFAVRTFGLPGADGLLGVCFGRVVTANSPASQGESPANWESVLWHEYCHSVTLGRTRNAMPRWLSEGISVYEEQLADPAWGAAMNPRFRAMLLDKDLPALSRLSATFLAPKTPLHLQFAYFESALAVEFLVQRAGLPALKGILDDLGNRIPINEALPRRTKTTLEELDRDFARFARERAEGVARGATWDDPNLPPDAHSGAIARWLETHPRNVPGLRRLGARLVIEGDDTQAEEVLKRLKALYPEDIGPENAYMQLAQVYRRRPDAAAEHAVLEELAARDGNAVPAYLRLADLDEAARDWRGLARNANRLLAVNPLIPAPHRLLARAAEVLGDRDQALAAYRALTRLDDPDPAEIHFRLAKLLHQSGKDGEARREVLKALEEAPRFLEAHRLLLELPEAQPPPGRPPAPSPAPAPAPGGGSP